MVNIFALKRIIKESLMIMLSLAIVFSNFNGTFRITAADAMYFETAVSEAMTGQAIQVEQPDPDEMADQTTQEPGSSLYPTEEDINRYIEEGTWEDRVAFMKDLGNEGMGANLIDNLKDYDKLVSGFSAMASNLPEGMQTGMPTTGTGKVVVLTIEFADMKFDPSVTQENLEDIFFGEEDTDSTKFPYESLSAYYSRSSYGKLDIDGDVFTGASLPYSRSHYVNYVQLVMDTIEKYDEMGIDFSEYDGNDDGIIDNVYIHFAGPNTGWGEMWWSYCSYYFLESADYVIDNINLGTIVMLHDTDPVIPIHETGHVFGLPDYYDYVNLSPNPFLLAIKANDMMNNNFGDHNGFSKLLLGWIDNVDIVLSDTADVELRPLGEYGDIAIVFTEFSSFFSEYFLIEYSAGGNFKNYKPDDLPEEDRGLRIFHINAKLQGDSFVYTNTSGKMNIIEAKQKPSADLISDEMTFFLPGDEFTPYTVPSSGRLVFDSVYQNPLYNETTYSGIHVTAISHDVNAGVFNFDVSFESEPLPEPFVFEVIENDQSVFNSVIDFQMEAPGIFFEDDIIKPYIQIGGEHFQMSQKQSHGYNYRNILRLMYFNDPAITPETQYSVVIPAGAFSDEFGRTNEYMEVEISTDRFLDAQAVGNFAAERVDVGVRTVRDDGKIVTLAVKSNYYLPDCLRVVDPVTQLMEETLIPFPETGMDGFGYDKVIELFDGNLAFVFIRNDQNVHDFRIFKVDLYGEIISDVSIGTESRSGYLRYDFIPFSDGLLFRNYDMPVPDNDVTYIDLNDSGSPLGPVSAIGVDSKYFRLFSVDETAFCIFENIPNYPLSKAYLYDGTGNLLQEFYHEFIESTLTMVARTDENEIVVLTAIANNRYLNKVYVSKYFNGELVSDQSLFEDQIWLFDEPQIRKTSFGFEVHRRIRYRLNAAWNANYLVIYMYDKNLNLIGTRAVLRENQGIDGSVVYAQDGKCYLIWWNGFEIWERPDPGSAIEPIQIYEPVVSSELFPFGPSGLILNVSYKEDTVRDILDGLAYPSDYRAEIVVTYTGEVVREHQLIQPFHSLRLSSDDGRYRKYYHFDIPKNQPAISDSDLLDAILQADPTRMEMVDWIETDKNSDGSLSAGELYAVRILELMFLGLTDVHELAYFGNLKILNLGYNQISDISFARNLDKLLAFIAYQNSISDISDLQYLTDLRTLSLDNNNISDIRVINNLNRLDRLEIRNNTIDYSDPEQTEVIVSLIRRGATVYADIEIEYTISKGEVTITKYNGIQESLVLPSEIDGFPVTAIGDRAFAWCSSLKEISIPETVSYIGEAPFLACSNLISIDVHGDNNSYMSIDGVLFDKNGSLLIQYPAGRQGSYIIPDGVAEIGYGAFYDCKALVQITIPDSIISVGNHAFYNCLELQSAFFLGDAPTTFGDYVFLYARPDFVICYYAGSQGWSDPWNGYKTVVMISGTVHIYGTAKYGGDLIVDTSVIVAYDTEFSYQWNRNGTAIPGADQTVYTVASGDIGQELTVTVTGTGSCEGSLTSEAVIPLKADGPAAPSAPSVSSKKSGSVTLNALAGHEYSLGDGNWQTSGLFGSLAADTQYTFYARVAETDTHFAGEPSEGIQVTTEPLGLFDVTFKDWNGEILKIQEVLEGFAASAPPDPSRAGYTFTGWDLAFNNVTEDMTITAVYKRNISGTVAISGTARFGEQLSADIGNVIPAGATLSYQWKRNGTPIGEATGLTYTIVQADVGAQIIVSVSGTGDYIGEMISLAVTPVKAEQSAPQAPVLASKTSASVTLVVQTGFEYRMNSGAWQTSGVFTGLEPNTAYSFYARRSETGTHFASASSVQLEISTDHALIETSNYFINRVKIYISRISDGTTVSDFISGLQNGNGIEIFKGNTQVGNSELVGTGMLVRQYSGATVTDELTIVVTGDINGDGKVTLTDFVQLKSHILRKTTLTGAFASAADLNGDGKITLTDFVKAKAHLLRKEFITPQAY